MLENKRMGKCRPEKHYVKERQIRIHGKSKTVNSIDNEPHGAVVNKHASGAILCGSESKPAPLLTS